MSFVVQAQDVQPIVAPRVAIPHPAIAGLGVRAGAGGMAELAVHFIGHREHDVGARENLPRAVGRGEAHHRILVRLPGIIIRRDRHTVGSEPLEARIVVHRLGCVVRSRHRVGIRSGHGQADIFGGPNAVHLCRVLPEVALSPRRSVVGSVGIRHGVIRNADARHVRHQSPLVVDELRVDRVVGRENREDGVVTVHAVHAQVVPAQKRPVGLPEAIARANEK